ncbi:TetR/AcrR family transcriptional regulator [Arthrobacter sp.]|uniref:TetR/AcrR family transcriptional regulator n=1 Tax=Arthrobacter sp. TaxID=1667 RepID=UPI002810D668|nr:TetR/AcrR family transcriptional regulator [Arthrobacter sp.]
MSSNPPAIVAESPPPPLSRRELNKTATRQAITRAAMELIRTRGVGNFTVEDIADAAGVSRRTFFNYYASTEAAIGNITHEFLEVALQQFRLRPRDEPVIVSAKEAMMALADPMAVAPVAELFTLMQQNHQLARPELEAWDHCTGQIIEAARERMRGGTDGQIDELYLRALSGSVISCGRAAMDVWFSRCGPDLSEASMATLRQLMIDSLDLLASGFATSS